MDNDLLIGKYNQNMVNINIIKIIKILYQIYFK
jgi:hypothetical protein